MQGRTGVGTLYLLPCHTSINNVIAGWRVAPTDGIRKRAGEIFFPLCTPHLKTFTAAIIKTIINATPFGLKDK